MPKKAYIVQSNITNAAAATAKSLPSPMPKGKAAKIITTPPQGELRQRFINYPTLRQHAQHTVQSYTGWIYQLARSPRQRGDPGVVAPLDRQALFRLVDQLGESFRTKVRYAHGGWEWLNFNHWEGIASPTDQNDRHILVLEQLIRDNRLAPTRLGFTMTPRFVNIVLVQPTCSIVGDYPADVRIHRADSLVKKLRAEDPTGMDMLKLISAEALHGFAAQLVAFHTPAATSEIAIPKTPQVSNTSPAITATPVGCQDCGGSLSSAEAGYCRANTQKFGGRLLCRRCQSPAPATTSQRVCESVTPTPYGDGEIAARCAHCGSGLDRKVVAFCRFNSKRFAGRVLCRACQETLK